MNSRQLHEYLYLLSKLDDEDTETTTTIFREALQHPKPARYHWVEGPALRPLVVTPRLVILLIIASSIVSFSSLLAATKTPIAIVGIPLYLVYCGVLILIRIRMEKTART